MSSLIRTWRRARKRRLKNRRPPGYSASRAARRRRSIELKLDREAEAARLKEKMKDVKQPDQRRHQSR